ncbi:hypothetical protein [Dietzia maris]|uniref:Two-component sensor histidine kinase n=1 Tax=Dietzia maris TaxID=37915 RepID=A0ABT8GZG0_9ACTN|nr:hypothetical protein [Dietzia maris]MDN4505586.1 hypothetical protein [Dietzia maris]
MARAIRIVIYVLAVVIPVAIALALVGTIHYLLAKVREQHRDTVAAIGEGAVRLSGGNGGIFGSPRTPTTAAQYPLPAGTMSY